MARVDRLLEPEWVMWAKIAGILLATGLLGLALFGLPTRRTPPTPCICRCCTDIIKPQGKPSDAGH